MSGGGGGGNTWVKILALGVALLGVEKALAHAGIGQSAAPFLLAIGGLMVVFGSCEAMILAVSGIGERLDLNPFVAGTLAGVAGNVPEIVMLGFVLAAKPRIGFIVVALTLHVGAMAFGVYSGLLPRDAQGYARLPDPLVKLSTDQFAGAAGAYFAMGLLMLLLRSFGAGAHGGDGLGTLDLVAVGSLLLLVQIVGLVELVRRFGSDDDASVATDAAECSSPAASSDAAVPAAPPPAWSSIGGHAALGLVTSVVGGHAVGDFADVLVEHLTAAGYSEMVGALVLSVFACAGGYIMIATAHVKKNYDLALANVSGAISQNAVLVMPIAMILLGIFGATGVIPRSHSGAILPIDLETTSTVLLTFPPLLMLWKAVKDDGRVSWVETSAMTAVFGLTLYFLAAHG